MAAKLVPLLLAAAAGVISVQYTLGPELERQAREKEAKARGEAGVPVNVIETPTTTPDTESQKSKSIETNQSP
ncbi:hypothetical protein BLS_008566 [Venturia inaequalis]|uniref:Uncharacterized protein n=1 Tax=Venturia inaequalis TaxID=5025 RepID=A0A8H3U6S1_VENIN|nr:hypothetical protein BLS_008566 [Venturia inaequalis]KAE9965324.1 hypothetical protein EG328_009807 [Venturia inaequalis]KAE9991945.1 hypothetical protein EG327_010512 [Venturia inaequalis]RDI84513.1 hypothetical protein Vi05172_g5470 [Venturia inaequalis]